MPACTQHLSLKLGVSHRRAGACAQLPMQRICAPRVPQPMCQQQGFIHLRGIAGPLNGADFQRAGRAWQCLASTSLNVPQARCYLPVSSSALPAIFFCLIMSTTTPQAQRASSCPTKPAPSWLASPFSAGSLILSRQHCACLTDTSTLLLTALLGRLSMPSCLALLAAMRGGWHSPPLAMYTGQAG